MAGRVDEVQLVSFPVASLVIERYALRLDRDAAFPLEVHGVEYLLRHFAIGKAAAHVDETVSQGRLAVINMGDDGEVAYVLH
mgnify:CR=1 FL=1